MKLKAFLKSAEDLSLPRAKISLWGLGAFISQARDTKQVTQVTPGPKGPTAPPPELDNIRLWRKSSGQDDPPRPRCCGRVGPSASCAGQEWNPGCTAFGPTPSAAR